MALRKVEGAFCRIRMVLPNGQSEVTIGSGCIVYSESLLSHFPDQPDASSSGDVFFMLTSKQVFDQAEANGNSKNSFKAEFLKKGDRKLFDCPLDLSYSLKLPGRVLGQSGDAEYLTAIPVGHLVTRYNIFKIWLKRTLTTDRFLGCRRESAENLKSLLSSQQIFCYVCCDSGFSRFDFEAYYLKLDGDDFSLNPVSGSPESVRKESDFNREAKPCGALLMNTDGECVGVLTLSSQERKILPLFLPLHEEKKATENTEISRTQGQTSQEIAESAAGAFNKNESTLSGSVPSCRTYSEGQRSGDTCRNNTAGAVSSLTDREPEISDVEIENEENRSQESSNSQADTRPQDDGSIHDDPNGSCEEHRSNFPIPESVDPDCESKLQDDPVGAPAERNGNFPSTGGKIGYPRSQSQLPLNVSQDLVTGSTPSPCRSLSINPPKREHIEPGSFVVQKVLNNLEVLHTLALYLNTTVFHKGAHIAKSWLHFAEKHNVPSDVVEQCQTISSPSVEMFQYICTLKTVTIEMLKEHVQPANGNRKDVLDELNKSESGNVRELCDNEHHILGRICVLLDQGHYNWRSLGLALGIKANKLELFEGSSEVWPTEMIFTKLKTRSPNMKITEIRAILENMERDDVCKELRKAFGDDDTVTTLVRNVDVLNKVTRLLGKCVKGADNWVQFARHCGFSRELCDSLKPSCDANPIKSILKYITQRNPCFTMASFLKTLKDMERKDVLLALGQFFYSEDIYEILKS